jgi:hypothetical protein
MNLLMNWRTLMTDMKTKATEVLYAYMDVEKGLSQPKILIHTFKELIKQLGYFNYDTDGIHGNTIVDVRDILGL